MFISKLKSKIHDYDPYGEFRTNGLKILFILQWMFVFNCIYAVPNPYFYFFYISLTAFAAETVGTSLEQKYFFLFIAIVGSALSVFLFGILSNYLVLFTCFVFFFSVGMYYLAIDRLKNLLPIVPVILSLASYSLIYSPADSDLMLAAKHIFISIVALLIMFAGLLLFPKKYYLAIWRRAFSNLIDQFEAFTTTLCANQPINVPILPAIVIMERYSRMLSRRMKLFSILKITLLTFELMMIFAHTMSVEKHLTQADRDAMNKYIVLLKQAIANRRTVLIASADQSILKQSYELKTLHQLLLSWNYLCSDI